MRKLSIAACGLVLLLQAACGRNDPPENNPSQIQASNSSKTAPAQPFGSVNSTPENATKGSPSVILPNPPGGVSVSKDFFAPENIKPPTGDAFANANNTPNKRFPPFPGSTDKKKDNVTDFPKLPATAKTKDKKTDKTDLPKQPTSGKQKKEKKKDEFKLKQPPPNKLPQNDEGLVAKIGTIPEYQRIGGKTIDEWIQEIPSKDRSRGENAIRTVVLFGPKQSQKAAPRIILELKKHDRYRHPVDASIRINASQALGDILADGNKSDPKLVAAAVYYLNQMLRDSQVSVKYHAALSLGKIGPAAAGTIPTLIECLRDRSTWEIRQAAALALGRVSRNKKKGPDLRALDALYGASKVDAASQVRLAAIQSLAYLGPPPSPQHRRIVRQKLDEVSNTDPDDTVRLWAHMAVMSISGEIDPARVRFIGRLIGSGELPVKIQAIKAIGAIGLKAKNELPTLIGALDDPEPVVAAWAMMSIQEMKRFGEDAVTKLQQIASNKKKPEMLRNLAKKTIDIVTGKGSEEMGSK